MWYNILESNSYSNLWANVDWNTIHPEDLFLFTSHIFFLIIIVSGYCLMTGAYSPENGREQYWAKQSVNICQCLMSSSCQVNSCWLLAQHIHQGGQAPIWLWPHSLISLEALKADCVVLVLLNTDSSHKLGCGFVLAIMGFMMSLCQLLSTAPFKTRISLNWRHSHGSVNTQEPSRDT